MECTQNICVLLQNVCFMETFHRLFKNVLPSTPHRTFLLRFSLSLPLSLSLSSLSLSLSRSPSLLSLSLLSPSLPLSLSLSLSYLVSYVIFRCPFSVKIWGCGYRRKVISKENHCSCFIWAHSVPSATYNCWYR